MKFWLLTHSEEFKKENSTGNLSALILDHCCEQILWERKSPSSKITDLLVETTLLIYPNQSVICDEEKTVLLAEYTDIVILDGTWQQAKKMYNHSPYLQNFRHHAIEGEKSQFKRRRNQLDGGLCTAEVIVHLLKQNLDLNNAQRLESEFERFNNLIK
ncbi:DTW domain-containing protein [Marinomonas balearica]|uniref:tRNA-uridine aminocarboxypropyltransferase n=1 Tax=Marinomonas balearica TaxID=491947 RepID=A0A4R6M545_9GAMM|nr:tRNA-uridine aminocarboxypropyltransferase [Marinomonas balearica]TDO96461.1 DTW domain-containing protein [Marinomonas balearica]